MGGLMAVPQVLPFSIPLPGVFGTIANGIVQGIAAGGVVVGGHWASGKLYELTLKSTVDAAAPNSFTKNWGPTLFYGAAAGIVGGLVAMVAPKGRKLVWSLLAAAGPGIRAFGQLASKWGLDTGLSGVGDYVQAEGVGDYVQAEGVGDYLQEGMGQDYAYEGQNVLQTI